MLATIQFILRCFIPVMFAAQLKVQNIQYVHNF